MDRLRVRTITTGLGAIGTNGNDDGARDAFSSPGVFLFYYIYIYQLIRALHSISTRPPPLDASNHPPDVSNHHYHDGSTRWWQTSPNDSKRVVWALSEFYIFTSCFFVITNAFILTKVLGTTYKMLYPAMTTTSTCHHHDTSTRHHQHSQHRDVSTRHHQQHGHGAVRRRRETPKKGPRDVEGDVSWA